MTTSTNFFSHLNPSQRRAVEHFEGPLLVVAGAGSGKTRALTYRIANLILNHRVNPEHILAVTFTNKAAREMKDRIEKVFAQNFALTKYEQPFDVLTPEEQVKLRSKVYHQVTKPLWIGTFHSLFSRILRYDINKYEDDKGRKWDKNFSIFDESDAQSLVKNIVTKSFDLDDKKFNPKSIRYLISNAKNLGESPEDYLRKDPSNYKQKIIAQVYDEYQNQLAANNALDFDDLILVPVRLFQQNETVLDYWHRQFQHILVDEYQDTNRTQYELIRLLTTNGIPNKKQWVWDNRSVFVVGDADQSIYSFRMADYTILLGFQQDFGDGLGDEQTKTMVKLEENYRSRENILEAANYLIDHNTHRIEKVLKPTRGEGEQIYLYCGDDEQREADFVVDRILSIQEENPELNWGSFAILYRTNAQSRPFEDALRGRIPYIIVGGLKFYDRKEIKDAIAYLRIIANPADTVSILRVINTPKRGIGQATIDHLMEAAKELNIPLWEILSDETSLNAIAGRKAKTVNEFVKTIQKYQDKLADKTAIEIVQGILEDSGYIDDLKQQGTDEAENRLENIYQLYSAVEDFQEDNDEPNLQTFLATASLASDLDNLEDGQKALSLMTLHSAKGLEFPIVFLVGLEQGLFPNHRAIQDPLSLEEERRLCYVGITRAQEQLFITYTKERRLWGYREPAIPSQFLKEIPKDLINHNLKKAAKRTKKSADSKAQWQVGDRVYHPTFGEGEITHTFGAGTKINLAIQFENTRKIINPKVDKLEPF